MCSVLDTSVKTRKGLEIVRDFAAATDGHGAWVALHAHYSTTSLQAQHRLAALHTKITSTRLTIDYPDTYYYVFLTKFDRMLKDHAAMCPPGGRLTDHLKCTT
jgi:hypothetical protein